MHTTLGHSDDVDSIDAIEDVIRQCHAGSRGLQPKAGILFASREYEHGPMLERLQKEWPGLPLIGASSDGELSSAHGFCHDSVLLTLMFGDELSVTAGLGRGLSVDPQKAVEAALGDPGAKARLCITMFAPSTDSCSVVEGLDARLGGEVPILGGLSGDHRDSNRSPKEFFGGEVLSDSLPLLLFSGDFACSYGVGSGWFPFGEKHVVTRAEGHVVHEIDGRPAIETYRAHYGAVPGNSLGEHPLAVYASDDSWSLRATLEILEDTGSLRFAGAVPQGSTVRITQVLSEGILSGSAESLRNALAAYAGSSPEAALIFSCAARKWVLGTQAQQEIDELRLCASELGKPALDIAGLYVFGEICPLNGAATFHNETCVSLVIGK